ncbi:helix-turn-helix domain-containing protein [Ruminococcaceae bacterium OttesenSCG-928-N02]|nr:helix-turn-helix domain-containing protein [Ruminococcaceae bacterium OttesenSCG-928-N02]
MAIVYKVDVMQALKEAGYTTYRLRQEKIIGQATLQQLRAGNLVSWSNIEKICVLLDCQPGDIIKYVPDKKGEKANGQSEK